MVLATGYNGSVRGMPHCDDAGHLMVGGSCKRTVHAEANAVAQAARAGVRVEGSTAFVTTFPCRACMSLLINAGVAEVVYGELYGPADSEVEALAVAAGLRVGCIRSP